MRGGAIPVDRAVLTEALELAAGRCGRLSDEQVRAMRRRRRTALAGAGATIAAGALVIGLSLGGPAGRPVPAHWTREVATRAGERGTVTLVDGSTVRLNGATRVRLDFGEGRRTARLLAGQAQFDVRHDPARPFTVHAGSGEARVLGTAFDLDLRGRQLALSVYRGAVGFDPAGAPRRGVVVRAGYRSSLRDGVVAAPTRFDPTLPDWWQGWIDTGGMRLDDLVDVLNRQGGTRIAPPPPSLAAIRVSGRFRTDRPRQILGAMGDGFGFTVMEGRGGLELRPVR